MIQVTWMDARGAGRMRAFDDGEKAAVFLSRLGADATARDSKGEVVGSVSEIPRHERVNGRIRWHWWMDSGAE
jgi:hypothetical protein